MLRYQIRLAIRVLLRRRVYSVTNCVGLAIGIAAALVIWRYAEFELSYDTWQPNSSCLYRTLTQGYINGERVEFTINSGHGQGPAMVEEIPEIARCGRIHIVEGGGIVSFVNTRGTEDQSREENMYYADGSFVEMMGYSFLSGDKKTALKNPASALITRATAERYFNDQNALGKELMVTTGYVTGTYTVVGVLEDPPQQSHLSFDILLSMHELLELEMYSGVDGPWDWTNFFTYVELHPESDPRIVEAKLPAMVEKYRGKVLDSFKGTEVITLQPIESIHLTSNLDRPLSEKRNLQFLLAIAMLIVLIAWLNFINLSTARSLERAREVGVRKTIGAGRAQLLGQFFVEALVVNAVAIVLAIALAAVTLPIIGDFLDKQLHLMHSSPTMFLVVGGAFVFSTLATGSYPAFVLSSFRPARVIKGGYDGTPGGLTLRKALVIFQFTVSLVLLAGTFAIYLQISFLKTHDTGFNLDRMLVVKGPRVRESAQYNERLFSFKEEIKRFSFVQDVASSGTVPGRWENSWGATMNKKGSTGGANGMIYFVDRDFPRVYGLDLLAGRAWDSQLESDLRSVLINESAVTAYGFGTIDDAIGEELVVAGVETVNVVGVLKNYHWNSMKSAHSPIVLWPAKIYGHAYSIRLQGSDTESYIASIRDLYKSNFPGNPFDFYFLEDQYNGEYRTDLQFGQIFGGFSILAVIVACLGLFGLASYSTLQRQKEISIRKILGASVTSILALLSTQFMKLVLIAGFLAGPLIWWSAEAWLSRYPYRISVSWTFFAVPFAMLALLSLLSVSIQTIRGATSNPAEILKHE